jgi:hypothetical protein
MMLRSWAPVFHEVEISAGQTSPIRSSHTAGVSAGELFPSGTQKEIFISEIVLSKIEKSRG